MVTDYLVTGGHHVCYWGVMLSMMFRAPLLVFLYAVAERLTKENWVLLDTFRRSNRVFLDAIEGNVRPVFVVDDRGTILFCNQGALKTFLEQSLPDMPNSIFKIVHERSQDSLRTLLRDSMEQKAAREEIAFKSVGATYDTDSKDTTLFLREGNSVSLRKSRA